VYGVSDEALEIARAFDQLQPQAKEYIREQVFIYTVVDKSIPVATSRAADRQDLRRIRESGIKKTSR
jgi:hypothetical protein